MTNFTQELFDEICDQISDGKSLRDICKADDMPNKATVFRWLAEDAKLSDQYARAREEQADAIFDECLSIADQYTPGSETETPDHIMRARLRIDTRKWMAGKLRPKRYGDKIDVTSAGEKIAMPQEIILRAANASDD